MNQACLELCAILRQLEHRELKAENSIEFVNQREFDLFFPL